MERDYDYLFNIILLGDIAVGKSSILMQYKDGKFAFGTQATLSIDFCIETHEIDGSVVKVRPPPLSFSLPLYICMYTCKHNSISSV